ncbi:lipopolysaccharide biosynthesis protein [Streptomyces sp. 35G-GA-8]|uniref:lipopolysaccharide biosynthesis protein n=1 Tax=Streptomyces sp. 35G-GA-8 TaxID=2939434 RepID=UPI00201EC5D0|nr:lipopolysaccharide biosynthesis protein [Streptomyces sp. 35G-GA-8]MCL7380631.1 lipopolysaccharide biosynthesis protein [Streptomyces sp. 35G-GA-8]
MLSTGVSAALGLGFWLVAARYYTEEAVGQGSAAIAAMRLLASLTATTMIGAVVRYVPRAGRATGALVWRAYAVSSLVVCAACVVFLATLDLWGPSYAPLDGVMAGVVFTSACVAWALLTLQDGVLTGLRKAFWVPVGNAAFSLGKLLLLAAFATAMPVLGVFVSWAAAIALSVLPLGWLIFRRLIPRQAAADHDREPPGARDIGRFLAGDSVGALFSLAMINLLPVLVAVRFDAAHNAFFYTAYTVGGTMEFMAINMASSLTAHASHSPDRLAEGVRGALRRMTVLLVPVVLVLVVFAPQVLAPFGADYARHGSTVLRLLAAAALPRVVVELYIGVLRVQGRTGMLAALQGAMCVLVLGSALFLLGPAGISGAGLAMLLSMTVMALIAAPGLRAALRKRAPRQRAIRRQPIRTRAPRTQAPRTQAIRTKGADAYGTSWAREAARLRAEAAAAPAHHLPLSANSPASAAYTVDESRVITVLWLLLGLAAGLFWPPLVRLGDIGRDQLTGGQLLSVLPPLTLVGGILLIVVQCAAVSLVRPGPALLTLGPPATFAALHSAPVLLGVRPDRMSGPWHEPVAGLLTDFLNGVSGGVSGGAWDTDGVLRALPVVLQLLGLGLAAVTLWALGTDGRVTSGAVWVLAVAGWAAQKQFAAMALPVSLGVCAGAAIALVVLVVRRRHRAGTDAPPGALRTGHRS